MYKIIGANQAEYGPVTADQIRQWIAEGRVNAQTMAQAAGDTSWKPISEFSEFAYALPGSAAAPPPGAPITPPPIGAAPSPGTFPMSDLGRAQALSAVSGPAIGLMVVSGLGILFSIFGMLSGILGFNNTAELDKLLSGQSPQTIQLIETMSSGSFSVFKGILDVALAGFILFGAIKMKKLESHGLCMAASILAVVPCCSPCCCVISIPIGIWALVIINRDDVKSFFT